MYEKQYIISMVILLFVTVLHEHLNAGLLRKLVQIRPKHPYVWIAFGILKIAWTILGAAVGPSVPVYLGVMGILCAGSAIALRGREYRTVLDCLIPVLLYSALILVLVGAVSMMGQMEIGVLLANYNSRLWILIIANLILCGLSLVMRLAPLPALRLQYDRKQDRIFVVFLASGIVYVMADSVLSIPDTSDYVMFLLLLTGNILILFLLAVFVFQRAGILQKKYVEAEHDHLVAELARERLVKEQLERSLARDTLTGCFSRRYALDYMRKLKEEGTPFSIAFIDMDGLKEKNDTCGHDAGDDLLRYFSQRMREQLGERGLFARVGGDEFLVIYPNGTEEAATELMETIRRRLSVSCEPFGPVLFSYGLASGEAAVETLIYKADQAMYADKRRRKREAMQYGG